MGRSRQFRLAARPAGEIKASDFELIPAPIPEAAENEFVADTQLHGAAGLTHVDDAIRYRTGSLEREDRYDHGA
jgi:hypothetical protein